MPIWQVAGVFSSVVSSAIVMGDSRFYTTKELGMILLGCLLNIIGVIFILLKPTTICKKNLKI